MDKDHAAADILEHALTLAAFDGWNRAMLAKAAVAAGYREGDAIRVFPGGAVDAIDAYSRICDLRLRESLKEYHLLSMKIRERIAACVRLRLEIMEPHREAVRRAMALESLPLYAHRAMKNLYRTVDTIWQEAGDSSTDFNFYTKRLLLAGVYSATLLYWLNDNSSGHIQSWEFLDRRIDDVMHIEKAKYRLRQWFSGKAA